MCTKHAKTTLKFGPSLICGQTLTINSRLALHERQFYKESFTNIDNNESEWYVQIQFPFLNSETFVYHTKSKTIFYINKLGGRFIVAECHSLVTPV